MTEPEVTETARPDDAPSLFAELITAVAERELAKVEALLADDVQWDMMPTGETLSGKAQVMPWLTAGAASKKKPVTISDLSSGDWGVFEYWNIGVVTDDLVKFGNQKNWPWPRDPKSLIGRAYKVAQCFVWRADGAGRLRLMRQYLDTGSVWSQFN